jgi:hypothetical protein
VSGRSQAGRLTPVRLRADLGSDRRNLPIGVETFEARRKLGDAAMNQGPLFILVLSVLVWTCIGLLVYSLIQYL